MARTTGYFYKKKIKDLLISTIILLIEMAKESYCHQRIKMVSIIKKSQWKQNSQELLDDDWAEAITTVMKADGITSKAGGKPVRKYLMKHRRSGVVEKINFKLKNGTANTLKESCIRIAAGMSDAERLGFVEFLFDIARLYKGIDQAEWRLLSVIMKLMGLVNEDIQYLERKYSHFNKSAESKRNAGQATSDEISTSVSSATSKNPALRVLGLEDSATEEEIQTAYRKLAKKYHPDTVRDEKMKLILTEKFKEISIAYDILTK